MRHYLLKALLNLKNFSFITLFLLFSIIDAIEPLPQTKKLFFLPLTNTYKSADISTTYISLFNLISTFSIVLQLQ